MGPERIAQLSPRERDCLRLVGRGRSSKEIALELGLSPFTVDEYVRAAIAKLGAPNRREAARQLDAAEQASTGTPETLGDEPKPVAQESETGPPIPLDRSKGAPRWRLPFLRQGRQLNDLDWLQRLAWIVAGAVAIIILFSQLAQGMQVLQSIFQGR